jgi:cation transport protein ChaC
MERNLKVLADESELTRERLRAGTLLNAWRDNPPPGIKLRSEEELDESLAQTLHAHDPAQDVHVFGYGSLMWNPALEYTEVSTARIQGWHRRFCLRLLLGRGSPEAPGVMLALDRGGACTGRLYRIAAATVHAELRLLWRREMLAGSYTARWVNVLVDGRSLRAVTFIVDRSHPRYIGGLPVDQIAQLLQTGKGSLGTSRWYFDALSTTLGALNVRDAGIERLRQALVLSGA